MIIGNVLFDSHEIQKTVRTLAFKINEDYKERELLIIGLLKGSFIFVADIVRYLKMPVLVDFITLSSYIETASSGEISIHCNLKESVRGRDVLIVEDILDSGFTLDIVREKILDKSPGSLKICVLMDKPVKRKRAVPVDYVGFTVPDVFVVGYGTDYNEKFRNLPYIAELRAE